MSTQVFGDYDKTFAVIIGSIKRHFVDYPNGVFVLKVINGGARKFIK